MFFRISRRKHQNKHFKPACSSKHIFVKKNISNLHKRANYFLTCPISDLSQPKKKLSQLRRFSIICANAVQRLDSINLLYLIYWSSAKTTRGSDTKWIKGGSKAARSSGNQSGAKTQTEPKQRKAHKAAQNGIMRRKIESKSKSFSEKYQNHTANLTEQKCNFLRVSWCQLRLGAASCTAHIRFSHVNLPTRTSHSSVLSLGAIMSRWGLSFRAAS